MFKTHIPVPDDYEFIGGRILNKSFVSFEMASSRFRDSVEYFDCLRKFSLESIVESEHGLHESISFSDRELRERIKDVCRNEFHAETHTLLPRKDLFRLCVIVRNRYGALQPQLSRLLGVDKEILDSIL